MVIPFRPHFKLVAEKHMEEDRSRVLGASRWITYCCKASNGTSVK